MTLKDFLNRGDRFAAVGEARIIDIAPGTATAVLKVTSAREGNTLRAEGRFSCDHHRIPSLSMHSNNKPEFFIQAILRQSHSRGTFN